MKRELMESSGLGIYAEIGIVIFVIVFIIILVRVLFMKKSEADELREIPLEDDISPDERIHTTSSAGHNEEGQK